MISWISRAFSEENGSPSSKRLFFGAAIFATIGYISYDIVQHRGLTAQSIELTTTLLYVTGAAYGVTRIFAENKTDPPPQTKAP
jgi:hypothetical protein